MCALDVSSCAFDRVCPPKNLSIEILRHLISMLKALVLKMDESGRQTSHPVLRVCLEQRTFLYSWSIPLLRYLSINIHVKNNGSQNGRKWASDVSSCAWSLSSIKPLYLVLLHPFPPQSAFKNPQMETLKFQKMSETCFILPVLIDALINTWAVVPILFSEC